MLFITSWIFYVNNRFWRIYFAHISFSALFLSTWYFIVFFKGGNCNVLPQVKELILFRIFLSTHWFVERRREMETVIGPFFTRSISTAVGRPNFSKAFCHSTFLVAHWRLEMFLVAEVVILHRYTSPYYLGIFKDMVLQKSFCTPSLQYLVVCHNCECSSLD